MRKPSPTLGAAAAVIGAASDTLVPANSTFSHSFEVPLERVRPDPAQARRRFDADAIAALGATLQAEGQLQPILLRPDPDLRGSWIIVAGERRWRAARLVGWTSLLAIVHAGDAEVASLLENLQRVDLDPVEEARGISRLIAEKGWTQEQAAQALGKPKSDVSGTLRILSLPEAVLTEVLTSELPVAKNLLIELSRVADPATQTRLAALARRGGLTIRAIRAARAAPSEALPQRARGPDEAGWAAVARAAGLVSRVARGEVALSEDDVASLRELRSAIDAALSRRSWT